MLGFPFPLVRGVLQASRCFSVVRAVGGGVQWMLRIECREVVSEALCVVRGDRKSVV